VTWRDLATGLAEGARALGDVAAAARGPHVRLDGRRVFLSDAALGGTAALLGRLLAPRAGLRVAPHRDGWHVGGHAGGRPVSAVVAPDRLDLARGTLRVELRTPHGIALGGRPVVARLARAVAWSVGGTWLARVLLALALPDGLAWDGERAWLDVALAGTPLVGRRLGTVAASARARRADGGLWLEFDRDGVAEDVVAVLVGSAVDWLVPGRAR